MANRKRRGRAVNGILIFDKPEKLSSNAALQQVKRLYFASKAGHTGSLDPLATGVLPICFGEATKFSQYLLNADKSYTATVVLGAKSSTEDADGEIQFIADASGIAQREIEAVIAELRGEQMQVPPMYSALKHQGQRLYKLARQGQEVERQARPVTVHKLELLALRHSEADPRYLLIDLALDVSKGTYVRSIAAEIGEQLGVGGYLCSLRRTAVSGFSIDQAVSLDQLQALKEQEQLAQMDELLLPVTTALSQLPIVTLDDSSSYYLMRGNPVQVPQAPSSGVVQVLRESGEFVGIAEIDGDGRVAPKRLIAGA
jgi:tRNA pseudouridine55 synthase